MGDARPTPEEVAALIERAHGPDRPDPRGPFEEVAALYRRFGQAEWTTNLFTTGMLSSTDWDGEKAGYIEGLSEERTIALEEGAEPTPEERASLESYLADNQELEAFLEIWWVGLREAPAVGEGVIFVTHLEGYDRIQADLVACGGPFRNLAEADAMVDEICSEGDWDWEDAFRPPEYGALRALRAQEC